MPLSVHAPADYAPLVAVGFGSSEAAATAVDPATPLPVRQTLAIAAAAPLTGNAAASAVVGPFVPDLARPIWLTLSGTWSGAVQVLRMAGAGAPTLPVTVGGRPWGRFTGNACEAVAEESVAGATYYLSIVLASGSVDYRVQQ